MTLTALPPARPARVLRRRAAALITEPHRNDYWTDFFAGAGGASTGLVQAGWQVATAANHWSTAVATHQLNHPDTRHLCEDINKYEMHRLPRTRFLWASVICTEESPNGGRPKPATRRSKKATDTVAEQMEDVPAEGREATRACAYDVIRATTVHRYDLVIVENVVEFYEDWVLFDWWTAAMCQLGYRVHIFSINSAHIGGPDAAPQWRDRIYVVFARNGVPMPDLTPRPEAPCLTCGHDVVAVQTWKNGNSIGKYRDQYLYSCPACGGKVEPYIRPGSVAIDFGHLTTTIAARRRPLVPNSRRKIQIGLDNYANVLGQDEKWLPLPTRETSPWGNTEVPDGVQLHASFVHEQRGGGSLFRPLTHPLGTLSTSRNHGIVVPAGVPGGPYDLDSCWYRMATAREALNGQMFPRGYQMAGNLGEQMIQAGNAVSVNVARWIGQRVMADLDVMAA